MGSESFTPAVVVKRGRVVAKIVPAQAPVWGRSVVLDEAEAFRKSAKIKGSVNIRELIEQGRR